MMKNSDLFYCLTLVFLLFSAMPAEATSDPQKVQDATIIWLAAIESGVTPSEPKKYNTVKKTKQKGNAQEDSESAIKTQHATSNDVVPGTNMSAMILDKLKVSEQVTPETTALFGETIDLNTGVLSLQQVDISIPGNFDIPVEFRRVYKGGSYSFYSNLNLGEWNIAIPSLSTTVIYDHITSQRFSGNWGTGTMCSGQFNPGHFSVGPNDIIASGDYWSGESLDIPGVASEKIQVNVNGRFIKNWRFSCTTVIVNGATMEGLRATSPQGITYEFTQPKLIPTTPMSSANGSGLQEVVNKYHAFLLVTKISDRFGNTVNYSYTDGQLTSISSSDGRQITIGYESNPYGKKRVSSVTANGQSWLYRYQNASHPSKNDSLIEVDRPDGRKWQFNLDSVADMPSYTMRATERDYYYVLLNIGGGDLEYVLDNIVETQCANVGSGGGANGYVVHPNGARLDLFFRGTRFGRTQVPNVLSDYRFRTHANDLCFLTNSVVGKTLSGQGLTPMNWQYSYSQNKGEWASRQYGEPVTGESLTGLSATPTGHNLLDLRSTTVTTPDGAKTIHVFSRRWDHTDGQEVATEYYDTNGTKLLRRLERQFSATPTGGSVDMTSYTGNELGTPYLTDNPIPHENYINKTSEKVISYVGGVASDSFITEFQQYNAYGMPTRTLEKNSLNAPERTTVTTYHQDETNWVLNQEANRQISQNGKTYSERSATFYPAASAEKSLPQTESRFGQLIQTHQYNIDGTLKKTTYALNNRWVEFADYKRGKPQSIKLPNRYDTGSFTVNLSVNNTGTIAWATDLNGNKTSYGYDELNRLKLIDPEDSQWLNTVISYDADYSGTAALQQNITRGNYRKTITLDALMQPLLSKEWDSNNEADTVRFINQRFNAYGKATFTSVPSASSSESYGSSTTYDGLQRLLNQTNTANGDLSFSYGNNNSITVTNGKGYSTTTQYLAYGSPATDLATQISQPEGATTSITYNEANLPETISQGDITEGRLYNSIMQLCLQKRPDTGIKVTKYNVLGQVTDYAEGLTGTGSHCTDYTNSTSSWVTQTYDNLGDARTTTYPDGTAAKTATLDRQGNLKTLLNGANSWSYDYNSLNMPYQQSLTLDSKTFTIGLVYNHHGHLQSKTYGGATLAYAPNALGQSTKVANSQSYVSNVLYHPNGLLKSYSYGNGLTFTQTLDNQFKPYERLVKAGSTLRLGQRSRHDNNGNLDAITDLVNSSQSINMTYDGLDRIGTASGVWGSGSFGYDTTGNISSKVLGTQNLGYSYHSTSKRLNTVTGGYSFSYDDRGNVINNGKRSFQFNRANQLTSSGTISYQYDGHGRRVKKTGSSTGYSVYDLSGTLLLTDGPNGQNRYIHLGKVLIAKTGSTAALEDKPGYTGHVEDRDIGLTYMQQRYYDPVLGRFYSNDPVGFSASNPMLFNRYAYANNNPYRFTDPNGAYPSPTGLQNMHKWQEEARVKAGMSHKEHAKAQLGMYGTAATLATPFAAAATGLRASATIIMSEASTAFGIAEASLSNTPGIDFAKEMISKVGGDHLAKISSGISREFGSSSVDALSRTLDFTSESMKVGVGSLIKSTPSNKDSFQGIQVYEVSGRIDAYDKRVGIEEK